MEVMVVSKCLFNVFGVRMVKKLTGVAVGVLDLIGP